MAIPAHVYRKKFGLINQLGFVDSQASYNAIEVSKYKWNKNRYHLGDLLAGFPVISGSDSHFLDDIGLFYMETGDHLTDYFSLKSVLKRFKNENNSRSSL